VTYAFPGLVGIRHHGWQHINIINNGQAYFKDGTNKGKYKKICPDKEKKEITQNV